MANEEINKYETVISRRGRQQLHQIFLKYLSSRQQIKPIQLNEKDTCCRRLLAGADGGANQQWRVRNEGKYYALFNKNSNLAITLNNNSTDQFTAITQTTFLAEKCEAPVGYK